MANGVIPIGLQGSEEALRRALAGSVGAIETGLGIGQQVTQPFTTGGTQAFNLQAALSGAGGPEAQQQAISGFQASPGQEFLRGEAERSLLRNQAAIGGIGGGNVRRALQEQAVGLAAQDFGQQFGRLGQVAGLGGALAGQQAGAGVGAGRDIANLISQFGTQQAGGRTRAGEQIAGAIGGTTSALSQLATQQGRSLADVLGAGGGNLANLLAGGGAQQEASQQALATLLANIATGQGTQLGALRPIPGIQQTEGSLGDISDIITAIGTLNRPTTGVT